MRWRLPGTAATRCRALAAAALLALVSCAAAAAASELHMAQATLMLPPPGNGSATAGDVQVSVQLRGRAAKAITASLDVLLPPGSGNASSDGQPAWTPANPDELWLEPALLSWQAGDPPGAKHVRLRSAAELPLAVVLEDALYASGGSLGGDDDDGVAAGQPLLRVQLVAASGASIDSRRNSTTLMLDAEEETADVVDAGSAASPAATVAAQEAEAQGPPLFGFVANQAAYPPQGAAANGSDAESSGGSIPVRLLAGQLHEAATLKYALLLLNGGPGWSAKQQFVPRRAASGFLNFQPPARGVEASEAALEQAVRVPIAWERVPAQADYRLALALEPVYNARVQAQPGAVALHVFGTRLGTCPPGSVLRGNGSSSGGAPGGSASSKDDSGTAGEEADFGLFLNGTVIDLSSSLLEADVREYAAMVDSDVASVTLCLRSGGQGEVTVTRSGSNSGKGRGALRPASAEVAAEACGCESGDVLGGGLSVAGSSSSTAGFSVAEDVGSSDVSERAGGEGAGVSGDSSCAQTAWVLPLAAGQNEFALTIPAVVEPPATVAQSTGNSSQASNGAVERYNLAVVRLADPDHADLDYITVKSSDDTTALLCGPEKPSGAARQLPSRTTLDMGGADSGIMATPEPQPCQPGQLLTLNVSDSTRLISLTPALRFPGVPGVRVEVNGQVLSRGGDVAADQLEDTTAGVQQRSNASFLPSAFIMGLVPGSRLEAEVVVVAEDGVTAQRYPLEFVVVPASRKQQLAVAASAANVNDPWTGAASGSNNGTAARPRGWPPSPALQAMCSGCPAGWAAAGVNASACHMCPPGTFAPAALSPACRSCSPGTFAYSWGSSYCKNCIEGTYAPLANSSLCLPCPANTTTREDGQAACEVPLVPGSYQAPRYAVVVSFWVILTGVDPEDVVVRAGVNTAPEAIVTSLIRADTAQQFNISLDDVQVVSVRQVARRTLSANVTATLGVDVPAGATDDDISAALEVERLSADDTIDMLSSDPDRFFGRTTKTLEVQVESAVQATTESRPSGPNTGVLLGMLIPGSLAILTGAALTVMGCRKSRACAKWRGMAARRLGTSSLAPRALAYSRYSGSSDGHAGG